MTKSYGNNHELNNMRQAIGIEGTDFGLSEADLWTLYQFDVPLNYDHFKENCEQVNAKYPTMAEYNKLERRYDKVLETNAKNIVDAAMKQK